MLIPKAIVKEFRSLTEKEKIAAHRVSDKGPYYLYKGYKISLKEVFDQK